PPALQRPLPRLFRHDLAPDSGPAQAAPPAHPRRGQLARDRMEAMAAVSGTREDFVPEVAQGIADWVADVVPAALPDDVIHEAKRRLIDSVGVAFAAYDCPPGIAARALCRRTRADPGATAI